MFRNVLYREIMYSGEACFMHTLCKCQSVLFWVFNSMGLKIIFHCFGPMSLRTQYEYSQSWNAVLCNNKHTTCGEKQHKLYNLQIKVIVDV